MYDGPGIFFSGRREAALSGPVRRELRGRQRCRRSDLPGKNGSEPEQGASVATRSSIGCHVRDGRRHIVCRQYSRLLPVSVFAAFCPAYRVPEPFSFAVLKLRCRAFLIPFQRTANPHPRLRHRLDACFLFLRRPALPPPNRPPAPLGRQEGWPAVVPAARCRF